MELQIGSPIRLNDRLVLAVGRVILLYYHILSQFDVFRICVKLNEISIEFNLTEIDCALPIFLVVRALFLRNKIKTLMAGDLTENCVLEDGTSVHMVANSDLRKTRDIFLGMIHILYPNCPCV